MHLRDRLRHALPSRPASLATHAPRADLPGLPVRRLETALGAIHLAEDRWPLEYRHGQLSLAGGFAFDTAALTRLAPGLSRWNVEEVAFVDVETTGLVGGTGTYVFLIGVGVFEDHSFLLRQYFLADVAEEAAMLRAVSQALADHPVVVSFNGRRFDLPLLETRFALSRVSPPGPPAAHLDLLYPARRLYRRRFPSCRLAFLEEALLGVERRDDVPGWAIPGLYFDYVRRGMSSPLAPVFQHNALDILSLVTLLGHLASVTGGQQPGDPEDCLALARWDEMEGKLEEAARLYHLAMGQATAEATWMTALRGVLRVYRRQRRWREREEMLRTGLARDVSATHRLELLVELAKVEEHGHRNHSSALVLTREALSLHEVLVLRRQVPLTPSLRKQALQHRLWRLQRRLMQERLRGNDA